MKSISAALLVSLCLAAPFSARAESAPNPLEALASASASGASAHAALAEYYRGRASEERALAARHRSQARHVPGGKLFQAASLKSLHTSRARQLEADATAHDALAEEQDAASRAGVPKA